jgi:cytochrome P450
MMQLPSANNFPQIDGAAWKAQRKMVATCFNEHNNDNVWAESLVLAGDMLRYWSSKPSVTTVAHDTRTLSLHVLSRAGFGKSFKFEGHEERTELSRSASYKDSLQLILENCVLIMAFGTQFLSKPWLPNKFRKMHESCVSFQRYMTDLYEEEKQSFAEGRSTDRNLMTSLVRASQSEATSGAGGLTEQEIYGNMFVLNFAGHDTTAHTFTFALFFLAANPDIQDWIHEEVHRVFGDRPVNEWNYTADFPKLKRCLSVMLETIRLYTPVPVAKWTDASAQSLEIGDRNFVVPPDTMVIPSYAAVHTDPRHWGSDPLVWRPSRWIKSASSRSGDEDIISPQRGTYLGWSEGARDCPGKRFSQVEFVATIATLFRDWRVDPVLLDGESTGAARHRVMRLIENDSAPVLLLQMLHPEKAPLVWKKR